MLKTCQFCGKVYKTFCSNRMSCSILLQGMKLKIENELIERKLKENDR